MYICENCKETFTDETVPTYKTDNGYDTEVGHVAYIEEFIDNCPHCGGNIVTAIECDGCGESMTLVDAEFTTDNQVLCPQCYEDWEEEQDDTN